MIKRILIASRGEIAVRIIRTCKILGIETVVVCSKSDKDSYPVFLADRAICIGEDDVKDSYLNIEKIINAAKTCDCDAIHPGYGFLSEDPDFATRVEKEGIIFIGPSAKTLKLAADKLKLKETAKKLRIPVVKTVEETNYPVLIKSRFGGGGKGIRLAKNKHEFEAAKNEIKKELGVSFKNDSIFFEKPIKTFKHIDIQFLADNFGNISIFPPRDCSVQRNFQKVIEETPAPDITKSLLKNLEDATRKIVEKLQYTGAGTAEFLLDFDLKYYFLELNARLQVEHTITEEITDIDLIEKQIEIASNAKLDLKEKIEAHGHAFEARIIAKTPGEAHIYNLPNGKDVRLDTYIYQGYNVKPFFDPLIAKLIVRGKTRERALIKLKLALDEIIVEGIKTNVDELRAIIDDEEFEYGTYSFFEGKK